jgi:hypothetical protein
MTYTLGSWLVGDPNEWILLLSLGGSVVPWPFRTSFSWLPSLVCIFVLAVGEAIDS